MIRISGYKTLLPKYSVPITIGSLKHDLGRDIDTKVRIVKVLNLNTGLNFH